MLLDYYYTIKDQRLVGDITMFDVILLPDCSVYRGHFPDMPVAPGVCNVQMIKECVERIAGKRLLLEYISQCKFAALITPQQHPALQIRVELTENTAERIMASASITDADEKEYVTFKGEFIPMP
jgi:3-hydroxyacyl-[acyl-carrier-protein] dehydratase